MSWVLLSVKLRTAESLLGVAAPIVTEECAGEMTKPVGTGGPTVNDALPVAAPDVADTVTTPCLSVVSRPVALIVARVTSDADQLAVASGFVVPSVKFPVAVNCSVSPAATEFFAAETTMLMGTAGLMLNDVPPVAVPDAADTVTAPCLSVVNSPVALTVASVASDVDQFAVASGFVVPSEKFPIAVNCSVSPAATEALGDVTVIDCRVTMGGPVPLLPPLLPPPHPMRAAAAHTAPKDTNRGKRLAPRIHIRLQRLHVGLHVVI